MTVWTVLVLSIASAAHSRMLIVFPRRVTLEPVTTMVAPDARIRTARGSLP